VSSGLHSSALGCFHDLGYFHETAGLCNAMALCLCVVPVLVPSGQPSALHRKTSFSDEGSAEICDSAPGELITRGFGGTAEGWDPVRTAVLTGYAVAEFHRLQASVISES
jgi:hypothetical protein